MSQAGREWEFVGREWLDTEEASAPESMTLRSLPGWTAGAVLGGLSAGVVLVSEFGQIEYVNQRAAEILGRNVLELVSARIDDVLLPFDELRARAHHREASEAPGQRRIRRSDDSSMVVGYKVAEVPCASSGGVAYSVLFQDITPWLRDEHGRLERVAVLTESFPALLHEIEYPLAAVGTALRLVLESSSNPLLRKELRSMLSELRRVSLTLERFGNLDRELRGSQRLPVSSVLRETFALHEAQANRQGIQTQVKVPELPALPLDLRVLRSLVSHLADNAIQACAEGDRIVFAAALNADCLELTVEDTGAGMTEAELDRCRDLFFTTRTHALGLGLSFCDRVVRGAGGELLLSSERSAGTRALARIPVGRPPPPPGGAVGVPSRKLPASK